MTKSKVLRNKLPVYSHTAHVCPSVFYPCETLKEKEFIRDRERDKERERKRGRKRKRAELERKKEKGEIGPENTN